MAKKYLIIGLVVLGIGAWWFLLDNNLPTRQIPPGWQEYTYERGGRGFSFYYPPEFKIVGGVSAEGDVNRNVSASDDFTDDGYYPYFGLVHKDVPDLDRYCFDVGCPGPSLVIEDQAAYSGDNSIEDFISNMKSPMLTKREEIKLGLNDFSKLTFSHRDGRESHYYLIKYPNHKSFILITAGLGEPLADGSVVDNEVVAEGILTTFNFK